MFVCSRWIAVRLELLANFLVLAAALFSVLSDTLTGAGIGLSLTYSLQVRLTWLWFHKGVSVSAVSFKRFPNIHTFYDNQGVLRNYSNTGLVGINWWKKPPSKSFYMKFMKTNEFVANMFYHLTIINAFKFSVPYQTLFCIYKKSQFRYLLIWDNVNLTHLACIFYWDNRIVKVKSYKKKTH